MTDYLDTPISWGSEIINGFVPSQYKDQTKFLHPPEFSKTPMFEGTVKEALLRKLSNPLGYDLSFDKLVEQKYQKGKPIVFVVDDYTRPNNHTKVILPIMIDPYYRTPGAHSPGVQFHQYGYTKVYRIIG